MGATGLSWLALLVAGLFEIIWAVGLKYTDGFTKLWPTIGTVTAMVISVALLGYAVRLLPLGTAYAVWTGVGTLGTVILGIWFFGEAADPVRLLCIGMIVGGIIGLKVVSG